MQNSGASSIKFQIYIADELCETNHEDYKIFKNLEFSNEKWKKINEFIKLSNINLYALCFWNQIACYSQFVDVDGIKIHASDLGNLNLIKEASKIAQKILGTGGRKKS